MAEPKDGCVKPARGVLAPPVEPASLPKPALSQEVRKMSVRVGTPRTRF